MLVTAGAFAEFSMSIGGGLLTDISFGNGYQYVEYEDAINNYGIGGFVFFDVTYAEIDIYFAYGILDIVTKSGDQTQKKGGGSLQLGFELIGKYPFYPGRVILFPLLGFKYNLALTFKNEGGDDFFPGNSAVEYFSQFSILIGVGLDIPFTSNIFLRTEVMLSSRFPSKYMNDIVEKNQEATATIGIGPRAKIAVGYKF